MRYSLTSKAFVSLPLYFFLLSCFSSSPSLPPAETLQAYVNALMTGDLKTAMALKYSVAGDLALIKEVIGATIVLAILYVTIRLTGMNPFSTMLSCMLIDRYVLPQNRKYILLAIGVFVIGSAFFFYRLLTTLPVRVAVEADRLMFEGVSEVEIADTRVSKDRAEVWYIVYYKDGRERERKAELVLQGGEWRVRRL